ncbi:MAG: translation initiation factor IF-3 [Zetaproteobacteria bacterium]|nr:translation initiation factor IF-3 [Zetaproteobacteria bacterium]
MEILDRSTVQNLSTVRIVGNGINEIIHIREALTQAEDQGLDLVLVSMDAKPPVVRIQDFKKIEYEKKKAKKANKPTNALKELKFKVNISDHDLEVKIDKIKHFLEKGAKVKIMVQLKGRERENPQRAYDLLNRIGSGVECKFSRVPGPIAIAVLEPVKAAKKP